MSAGRVLGAGSRCIRLEVKWICVWKWEESGLGRRRGRGWSDSTNQHTSWVLYTISLSDWHHILSRCVEELEFSRYQLSMDCGRNQTNRWNNSSSSLILNPSPSRARLSWFRTTSVSVLGGLWCWGRPRGHFKYIDAYSLQNNKCNNREAVGGYSKWLKYSFSKMVFKMKADIRRFLRLRKVVR